MQTAETLTITHTAEEGTLIEGTSKGDGSRIALRDNGWRWGRSIGTWYVPHSRDKAPKWHVVNATAAVLRAAGFTVEIDVDEILPDARAAEARKIERAAARAEGLAAKAERRRGQAESAQAAADRAHDALPPMGEPIKVGHHSQRRHERALDKAHTTWGKAIEADRVADEADRAARVADRATPRRYNPVTVANRIAKLEAEIRRLQRCLAGQERWVSDEQGEHVLRHICPQGASRDRLTAQLTHERESLEMWRSVRAEQVADGTATNYGRESVKKGDAVRIRGHWRRVARANAKTVSVETDYSWTDRAPWHEVEDHRPRET